MKYASILALSLFASASFIFQRFGNLAHASLEPLSSIESTPLEPMIASDYKTLTFEEPGTSIPASFPVVASARPLKPLLYSEESERTPEILIPSSFPSSGAPNSSGAVAFSRLKNE